jgi:polyhydroxybutyrate depolymerase
MLISLQKRYGCRFLVFAMFAALVPFGGMFLTGCFKTEDLELRTLDHDNQERTYYLHVPDTLEASTPAPLVIALHGLLETGALLAHVTGFNDVADNEHFIVAYPNGKFRRFTFQSGAKPDDAGFVLSVIEDIAADYVIDRSRIYLAGSSNGGFLVYQLVCEHPEMFAAAAPVISAFPERAAASCSSSLDMPMIIIHGDADPLIPYDAQAVYAGPWRMFDILSVSETVAFWAEQNGCDLDPLIEEMPNRDLTDNTTATRETYVDNGGVPKVIHIKVHNGGHNWPGGNHRVPGFMIGPQSHDFSATEEIWEFFALHQRETPSSSKNTPAR